MKGSALRVGIPFAETVEEPGGLTDFRVCPGEVDRPMPNGLTVLRRDLGHIVVEVATAEGPGEPAPAHPLCRPLSAQLFVGGNTEIRLAFALVPRNVCALQPI